MNRRAVSYLMGVLMPLGATTVATVLIRWLPHENVPLIYLAAVIILAVRTSTGPAMCAALVSFLMYNFFFTDPRLTFRITQNEDLLTAGLILLMAALAGRLAGKLSEQVGELHSRERYILAQLNLSQRLATLIDSTHIAEALQEAAVSVLPNVSVVVNKDGRAAQIGAPLADDDPLLAEALARFAENDTRARFSEGRSAIIPVTDGKEIPAVLVCEYTSREDYALLEAMVRLASLALTRIRLVNDLQQERFHKEQEVLRSSLLSSVSHDLRTPLASVLGSASSLREFYDSLGREQREALLETIIDETDRLNRYIQNLLDMTRIGDGKLKAKRDWASVEDIIAAAIRRIRPRARNRTIRTRFAGEIPLLFVQAAFIEQALFNLLDNAVKFSADHTEIAITASSDEAGVEITVLDQGEGIPSGERDNVFRMFHKAFTRADNSDGSGLGLAIARGMIQAHDGRLTAGEGQDGRGTAVTIWLPHHANIGGERAENIGH